MRGRRYVTCFLKWQKLLHDRFCDCFFIWYVSNFNSICWNPWWSRRTVSQGFNFTLSSSETDLKEHNYCTLSAPHLHYIQLFHSINQYGWGIIFFFPSWSSNELGKREEEECGTIAFHPLLKYQRHEMIEEVCENFRGTGCCICEQLLYSNNRDTTLVSHLHHEEQMQSVIALQWQCYLILKITASK